MAPERAIKLMLLGMGIAALQLLLVASTYA